MKKIILAATSFALSLVTCLADTSANELLESGNNLHKEKKYDDAIKEYTKAAELDPENAQILMYRGLSKSMKGDWPGCVEDLNLALKIDGKDMEVLTTRAFALLHTGDFEAAKRDFRAMDEIEKDAGQKAQLFIAQSLLRRSRHHSMADEPQKALDDINRVLAIAPANDIILYERACTLVDLKKYTEALKDLDKVIEIDGDISKYGDAHAQRAKVRRALKDTKGAEEDEAEAKRRSSR